MNPTQTPTQSNRSTSPSQPPSDQPITPRPSGRSKRRWIIVTVLILLILPGVAASLYLQLVSKTAMPPKTNETIFTGLSPSVTASDVAKLDKTEAFYAALKLAAQQSQLVITQSYYFNNQSGVAPGSTTYAKTGFNYQTKQFVHVTEEATVGLTGRDKTRCVDSKEYSKLSTSTTWHQNISIDDASPCHLEKLATHLNDGFNTGGLTSAQAESFVSYLRTQPGLIGVKSLTLSDHHGHNYLHFSVDLTPIVSKSSGANGAQWLMWAFRKTGLDPSTHPYGYIGAAIDGLHLEYYIDIATKLPAYSAINTTIAKDDQGKDIPPTSYNVYRTQYRFGVATFDSTIANNTDIALTW